MHYHDIFLIKAENKKAALEQTKKFLEPFDDNLEVAPYKEHLSEKELEQIRDYYSNDKRGKQIAKDLGVNPMNTQDLVGLLKSWDGDSGGIDEKGVYYVRTRNQQGEYDWYVVGGRWLWSKLSKEYEKYIIKPKETPDQKETYYWNHYHDKEAQGKLCVITFPDNTAKAVSYGMDVENAIIDYVKQHPYDSEILDATDPEFFNKFEDRTQSLNKELQWWKKQQEEYRVKTPDSTMISYYQDKIDAVGKRWQIEAHFWNITDNTNTFNKEAILKDPTHWFIVNIDLHS